jgi:hypothetical protein
MSVLKSSLRRSLALFLLTSVSLSPAFAQRGGTSSGGGDIQCDAQIKVLASNLSDWINNNGAEIGKLDLSSSLNSSTGQPYSYSEYKAKMIGLLSLPLNVSCVKQGDSGYPVSVDDSAKICATSVDSSGVHMICDRALFLALNPDQQIEQNHHEFAINVPGLEPDTGPISTYEISNQLSSYIETVTERRLVVKAAAATSAGSLPDASQPVQTLTSGTLLMLAQDVYVPLASVDTFMGGKVTQGIVHGFTKNAQCTLSVADSRGNPVQQNSSLGKNSTLTLVSVTSLQGNTQSGYWAGWMSTCKDIMNFVTSAGNEVQLSCSKGTSSFDFNDLITVHGSDCLNIGDLQQLLSGIANLSPAPPKNL